MIKRLRPARAYQRDDDPVLLLSRSAMRGVARELRHAFTNLSELVPTAKVAEAIKHGRSPKQLVNWGHYREVLRGPLDRLGKLRAAGGALGARKINGAFAAKRRKVRFHKALVPPIQWGGLASKAEANYRQGSKAEHCGICTMFVPKFEGSEGAGGSCTAVEGRILAADTCDFFFPAQPTIDKLLKAYNPDEPRDEHGRWTSGGGDLKRDLERKARAGFEEQQATGRGGASFGAASQELPSGAKLIVSMERVSGNSRGSSRGAHARFSYNIKEPGAGSSKPISEVNLNARLLQEFGKRFAKATGNQFNFDSFSPDVQDQIRQAQDIFIQQLEDDARDAIDTIIQSGIADGLGADQMAEDIRDFISLTDTQAQAVMNYRSMLEDLDPKALMRQLRNDDYDSALQAAIDSGEALAQSAIDSMVDDYRDNYLDYRAATIAQTESTRAANLGLHDAYSQAVERGALPEEAITRQWLLGDNPCPICESIVDNNEDGVGLNEPFESDEGPITDPPVHPNCECSVDYVTDLTKVPDDGESDFEFQTQAV